jgi:hypothetical protein
VPSQLSIRLANEYPVADDCRICSHRQIKRKAKLFPGLGLRFARGIGLVEQRMSYRSTSDELITFQRKLMPTLPLCGLAAILPPHWTIAQH